MLYFRLMKPLSRLESLIADILERPAWTLSSRKLHPLELTAALTKAMEARAVRLADRVLAPDIYDASINPADLAAIADAQSVLEQELGDHLHRTILERDLSCNARPVVRLLADPTVRSGKVRVAARFTPQAQPAGSKSPGKPKPVRPAPAMVGARESVQPAGRQHQRTGTRLLELLDADGRPIRAYTLLKLPVTIGRGNDAEITLFDGKVSREHARIDRGAGGYTVTDLHSLNGTIVNGREVRGALSLHEGDVLEIGRFSLRFRDHGAA